MKWFKDKPATDSRNMLDAFAPDECRPVPMQAEYVRVQMSDASSKLSAFDPSPVCAKCASSAIKTEYGSRWFVPRQPSSVINEKGYATMSYSYDIGPQGTWEDGPEYLVRSCTVCHRAWASRTAPEGR